MNARADIVGQRYGRLTVVGYDSTRNGRAYWLCCCDCGNYNVVSSGNLRHSAIKPVRSCGCLMLEKTAITGASTRRHGQAVARTSEYRAWRAMRDRCQNPNSKLRKYYLDMGVTVCDEWKESFEAFFAYVGKKPSAKHSLDRWPDPYGNYEPGNVRWATWIEQRHNRRGKKNV